jgi:hypothetical protein
MEPGRSLSCLQEPATGPYPKSVEEAYSPHFHTLFL